MTSPDTMSPITPTRAQVVMEWDQGKLLAILSDVIGAENVSFRSHGTGFGVLAAGGALGANGCGCPWVAASLPCQLHRVPQPSSHPPNLPTRPIAHPPLTQPPSRQVPLEYGGPCATPLEQYPEMRRMDAFVADIRAGKDPYAEIARRTPQP